jgi:hypothetical protein
MASTGLKKSLNNMIARFGADKDTIQALIVEPPPKMTYQFIYDRNTSTITTVYEVSVSGGKAYYNPVPLDSLDIRDVMSAYRQINTYLKNKK